VAKDFYQDLFNRLSGEEFEEMPVDVFEFTTSENYCGLKELSEYQYALVRNMSQIYKRETLVALYGGDEAKAERRWRETCREIIMQLGKGSGKDFTSTVAVSYVVYLLLCLKSPAEYYGKPKGDSIDIINIAINSDQANRVFFKNFVERIRNNPWFEGRYEEKQGSIEFDKNVTVYSGHSEREAFEGYNTLLVILDEISGFALTSNTGHQNAKTAPAIYDMYKGSVTSRFAEFGKLVLLSFPRFKDDFIQQKYKEVIAEIETIERSATLKVDPELPDGQEGNEFEIKWEEDEIIRYAYPYTFALRRPSWEVNPTKNLQTDYALDFYRNPGDALGRFACMPSNLEDGYFKRMDKVEAAFCRMNGVDAEGVFHPNFQPKDDVKYFMHVDLAQKHDKCAVAMGHVDKWIQYDVGSSGYVEYLPLVVIDALRWWTPTKDKSVDFKEVVEYIKAVRRRGFNLKLVTFDRWNSHDTMMELERNGIKTEVLSVAKKHYDDFLMTTYDDRLLGPAEQALIDELGELRLVKDKVDHPRKGNKDLSDAVCGAIFNSVSHTPKEENLEADALTLEDLKEIVDDDEKQVLKWDRPGVIVVPKKTLKEEAPQNIQDMIDDFMRVL
jgi:hypothetical protein